MLYFIVALVMLYFAGGVLLSLSSRQGSPPGFQDGRLHPCPGTPNCVCSEYPGSKAFIEPLTFKGGADIAWAHAQKVVTAMGGEVLLVENGYLAATFRTPLFRFVDDVELRLEREAGLVHIRSASRVGHSDMGTNRKRVAALRKRFSMPGSS